MNPPSGFIIVAWTTSQPSIFKVAWTTEASPSVFIVAWTTLGFKEKKLLSGESGCSAQHDRCTKLLMRWYILR